MKKTKIQVAQISVDSGLVWIGDPCYVHNSDNKPRPKEWGENYEEFLKTIWKPENSKLDVIQFNHDPGNAGLGACALVGGDGTYPVFAVFDRYGKLKRITIEMIY